jgi:hypothetical protein
MLDLADLRSMFELDDPRRVDRYVEVPHATATRRRAGASRSVRPRASSPHRLATGP